VKDSEYMIKDICLYMFIRLD